MPYRPPTNIWEVDDKLHFNAPLEQGDPRYVYTEPGRGDFSYRAFFKSLGVHPETHALMNTKDRFYGLFCGHRGCGKSTELRRLCEQLNHPEAYFVVSLDATVNLDVNNLQYVDVLMALVNQLFVHLKQHAITVDKVHLTPLENWFHERIETYQSVKEFSAEVKTGAKGAIGFPFLGTLFATISTAFKQGSSYKSELRKSIKNSFSEFATGFNTLLAAVESATRQANHGRKLLFIIDGTDRLSRDDSKRLFIDDVHQLQLVEGCFVYCAPIQMLYEGNQVQHFFQHFVLPMIKLSDETGSQREETGFDVLRNMVLQRVDESLFDSREDLDWLIQHSGGCPRELLKLLHYAFLQSESDRFDRAAIDKAIADLAVDYKRILQGDDYALLHQIDNNPGPDDNSERIRFLLFNLALLEYNGFWRRSHPVIQTLDAYQQLESAID